MKKIDKKKIKLYSDWWASPNPWVWGYW